MDRARKFGMKARPNICRQLHLDTSETGKTASSQGLFTILGYSHVFHNPCFSQELYPSATFFHTDNHLQPLNNVQFREIKSRTSSNRIYSLRGKWIKYESTSAAGFYFHFLYLANRIVNWIFSFDRGRMFSGRRAPAKTIFLFWYGGKASNTLVPKREREREKKNEVPEFRTSWWVSVTWVMSLSKGTHTQTYNARQIWCRCTSVPTWPAHVCLTDKRIGTSSSWTYKSLRLPKSMTIY